MKLVRPLRLYPDRSDRFNSVSEIVNVKLGVNAHRQVDVAVPCESLCFSWMNTSFGERRYERVSKTVKVENSSLIVQNGDSCPFQVSGEDLSLNSLRRVKDSKEQRP